VNCNPENYRAYLSAKILGWKEVADYGVDKYERARGRRNFWRLVRAHPEIAADCGVEVVASDAGSSNGANV